MIDMNSTAPQTAPLYRGMDRETLDAAYNNSQAVPDSAQWAEQWRTRSAPLRAGRGVRLDIPYAPQERTKFDYFPVSIAGAPLFIFIHGGYWVRNSRDMFSFVAEGPNARGINVAVVGYTLAPQARLAAIVDEISQCISFIETQAGELGCDRDRIYVGGWSAGGHLATMACDHKAVRGALPISGIFDLEPIALSYLNDPLQLDHEDIIALSPQLHLRASDPPRRLFVGGDELPELQRQSADYMSAARAAGLDIKLRTLPGHHHYSVLDELAKPDGLILDELQALIVDSA